MLILPFDRRYALGGRAYCAVNGLDGALDFIKDTIQLDIRGQEDDDMGPQQESRRLGKKPERAKMSQALWNDAEIKY